MRSGAISGYVLISILLHWLRPLIFDQLHFVQDVSHTNPDMNFSIPREPTDVPRINDQRVPQLDGFSVFTNSSRSSSKVIKSSQVIDICVGISLEQKWLREYNVIENIVKNVEQYIKIQKVKDNKIY